MLVIWNSQEKKLMISVIQCINSAVQPPPLSITFSSPEKKSLSFRYYHFAPQVTLSPALKQPTDLFSVYMDLPLLAISYNWNDTRSIMTVFFFHLT